MSHLDVPGNVQDHREEGITHEVLSQPLHRLQTLCIVTAILLIH